MNDCFSLGGKVAIVTGGGTGLGHAVSEAFLAADAARVYIASRKLAALERAAQTLSPEGRCIAIAADLSSVEGCRHFAREIAGRERAVHVLVNGSGIGWAARFDDFPESGWDKVFQLNLKAPFFLIQALLERLESGGGDEDPARVINIGSIAGKIANGSGTFPYGLSKGALHHATRMLALELGARGISVNAIAPGRFETKMTKFVQEDRARYERELGMIPLGRWGRRSEIGGVAVFLASRAGAYLTGSTIVIDGGLSLHHPLHMVAE